MNKTSQEIALDSEVLHAARHSFPLFYNKDYDLGKYLEPTPSPSKNSQISLSSMNISTKNITPPISEPTPKHDFLFIKK